MTAALGGILTVAGAAMVVGVTLALKGHVAAGYIFGLSLAIAGGTLVGWEDKARGRGEADQEQPPCEGRRH